MSRRKPKPQTQAQRVDALLLDFLDDALPLSRPTVLNIYTDRADREFLQGRLQALEEDGRVVATSGDRLLRAKGGGTRG